MMSAFLLQSQHVHAMEAPGWGSLLIVFIAAAVVAWVFYLAIRMTISPGETDRSHIKWSILEEEPERKHE